MLFPQTGGRLKHVIGNLVEGTMRICLDRTESNNEKDTVAKNNSEDTTRKAQDIRVAVPCNVNESEVGRRSTGFSLVLDEQWRGTAAAPSMKMV